MLVHRLTAAEVVVGGRQGGLLNMQVDRPAYSLACMLVLKV